MSLTTKTTFSRRGFSAATTAAVILFALTTCAYAGGDRVRVRCISLAPNADAGMSANFESKQGRAKFSVSFEAAPGAGVVDGDVLAVTVDGQSVGSITAVASAGGDVVAGLDLDTTAGPGDQDSPFPADFPAVAAGTNVTVGSLGCTLMGR